MIFRYICNTSLYPKKYYRLLSFLFRSFFDFPSDKFSLNMGCIFHFKFIPLSELEAIIESIKIKNIYIKDNDRKNDIFNIST